MKKWNAAEIVELNIAETADGVVPGMNEGKYTNDGVAEFLEDVQEFLESLRDQVQQDS